MDLQAEVRSLRDQLEIAEKALQDATPASAPFDWFGRSVPRAPQAAVQIVPARDLLDVAADLGEVAVGVQCCRQWLEEEVEDGAAPAHAANRVLAHLREAHRQLSASIAEIEKSLTPLSAQNGP